MGIQCGVKRVANFEPWQTLFRLHPDVFGFDNELNKWMLPTWTWRNFVPCSRDFLRMVRLPEREFWCSFSFAAMWPFWLYDAEHRNSLLSLRSGLYISLNQICSWVQENGGWSRVLHSGLNV